jgi:hypothetical protein
METVMIDAIQNFNIREKVSRVPRAKYIILLNNNVVQAEFQWIIMGSRNESILP